MAFGSFLSALLHLCILALAVLGLPSLFDRKPPEAGPVPVEIATLADIEDEKKPKPPEAAKPKPPKAGAPPPEPPPLPEPPPQRAPPPETAPPEPKPEPAVRKPPAKKPPPAAAVPRAKPKPPPRKASRPPGKASGPAAKKPVMPRRKPEPPQRIETVLKNLDSLAAPKTAPAGKREEPKRTTLRERFLKEQARKRSREAGIVLALRRQIEPCWNIPAGVKDAAAMKIPVRVRLRPDGALAAPPRVGDPDRLRDPVYRAVAESALRALRHPACTPFKLDLEDYEVWKEAIITFDPSEMVGE